jgi:hypothetical protein
VTEVRIATAVPKMRADPAPWAKRRRMTESDEGAKTSRRDERVKIERPMVKIFFRPVMSAILPTGRRKMADARRYAVETQLREMASIENVLPIAGRAMFTAERSKGVMKPARTAMNRATFLTEGSVTLSLHFSSCAVVSLSLSHLLHREAKKRDDVRMAPEEKIYLVFQ